MTSTKKTKKFDHSLLEAIAFINLITKKIKSQIKKKKSK